MIILQLTREIFLKFGIIPNQYIFRRPFNKRAVFMLFFQCLSLTSYSLFILRIANTFDDYANGAFMTTAVIAALFAYVTLLWDSEGYFEHMDNLERAINKSEAKFVTLLIFCLENVKTIDVYFAGIVYPRSKLIYKTFNKYVDLFCKCLYIGLTRMVPFGSMTPLLLISFISYYILDSGRSAFVLPFPMW